MEGAVIGDEGFMIAREAPVFVQRLSVVSLAFSIASATQAGSSAKRNRSRSRASDNEIGLTR